MWTLTGRKCRQVSHPFCLLSLFLVTPSFLSPLSLSFLSPLSLFSISSLSLFLTHCHTGIPVNAVKAVIRDRPRYLSLISPTLSLSHSPISLNLPLSYLSLFLSHSLSISLFPVTLTLSHSLLRSISHPSRSSTSPIRTRGQRVKSGNALVELKVRALSPLSLSLSLCHSHCQRPITLSLSVTHTLSLTLTLSQKTVVWEEHPNRKHDDFCAVCILPGIPLSLTHSLTHSFTHSLTHTLSLSHSFTHTHTHTHTLSLSLIHTHTHTHTHTLSLSLIHTHTHTHIHTHSLSHSPHPRQAEGTLLMCDGNCFRSFHVPCAGML